MSATPENLRPRTLTRAQLESYAQRFRTWGDWGPDDELGSANYVTADRVRQAAGLVRRGVVHQLALPLDRFGPQRGDGLRSNPQHVMLRVPGDRFRDDDGLQRVSDDAIYTPLQASTQWDALAHIFHGGLSYNGRGYDTVTAAEGATRNSITNLAPRSAGRGVLLDVARHLARDWLEPGEAIQSDLLEDCAAAQNVEVREGDFVLVRTGHMERRLGEGDWADFAGGDAPGLAVSAAEFLAPRHVAAVAVDTWAAEAMPFETPELLFPLHVALIVNAGIHIGEMWKIDTLAADCAEHGVYEFFLCAAPLMITGGVGSPLTPLAIL